MMVAKSAWIEQINVFTLSMILWWCIFVPEKGLLLFHSCFPFNSICQQFNSTIEQSR